MKVYLVEVSIGQWSDHRNNVVAVFDSREHAEFHASEITLFYRKHKENEQPPYPEDDYFETGKLTKEQEVEYYTWSNMRCEANDFNDAMVIEMEMNDKDQMYFKYPKNNLIQ